MISVHDYVVKVSTIVEIKEVSVLEAMELAKVPEALREIVGRQVGIPVQISDPVTFANISDIPKLRLKQDDYLLQTHSLIQYLQLNRKRNEAVIKNLVHSSKKILINFPDPSVTQSFVSKGLVVGYVQSGKTASMAMLISLAVDHGYRIIIVLSGLLNDLRFQTQKRFDEELTGSSEIIAQEKLVELLPGTKKWVRLTRSNIDDDFKKGSSDFDSSGESIRLAVIKKIPSRINALKEWLSKSNLDNLPALIIDDEADHATINTNYQQMVEADPNEDISPPATNKAIRELLEVFPKCVYIGYTATPFANFFIDSSIEDDLYPRDFICMLDEPPTYIGARKLFGLGMSSSMLHPEDPYEPELDIIKDIDSEDIDTEPSSTFCPEFLENALISFIVSCAGRIERGHNGDSDHFSMLIHPSYKTKIQSTYKEIVRIWIAKHTKNFHPTDQFILKAKLIWEQDFVPIIKKVNQEESKNYNLKFDAIAFHFKKVFESVEILELNVGSADKLSYEKARKIYIVIGGNKLSRGLTLEGLSVSVFFRTMPNAYDTALQMGRWFGYRDGYFDLTRIFVEENTAKLTFPR